MYGALPQESRARPVAAAGTARVSGGGGGGGAALIRNEVGRCAPRSDTARRVVGAKPVATASALARSAVRIIVAAARRLLQAEVLCRCRDQQSWLHYCSARCRIYVDACAAVGLQNALIRGLGYGASMLFAANCNVKLGLREA